MISENRNLLKLLQALGDPVRLAVLQHLMGGAAPVSEMVAITGASQPNVSNHLAFLREQHLVRATRVGRQMVYEIADASVAQLVEALSRVAGAPPPNMKTPPVIQARTCYDHLAGKLGVALFDALVGRQALRDVRVPAERRRKVRGGLGTVELGPHAQDIFTDLGIDLDAVGKEKRQFATACLDWTEDRPHVGGALGAALWSSFLERGWIARKPGSRAVLVTPSGRTSFGKLGMKVTP
jgi:DNA-binding transcriptional ArsR family regulator